MLSERLQAELGCGGVREPLQAVVLRGEDRGAWPCVVSGVRQLHRGQVLGRRRRGDEAFGGRPQQADLVDVGLQNDRGIGVTLGLGERLVQSRDGGHPAGEAAVENVAVDGPPQESGAGAWILDAAEGFHNMDPARAGDPVRRPEQ
ncbi:hypothetical protein [Streptomyces sp. A1-5]|uniref:hypothetical protein n=1 Tax=Streptomyces sp. A1-5 TaxID=2738410 RepID=UPI001F443DAB|nr:hypothetical protein [Streptomyces sp. A1-5]UJB39784.1 hypothetical protein HRD51_01775 [Streptomyces sp. A1-5]